MYIVQRYLEKDIDGEKCKHIVKSNKIAIKLRKVKGNMVVMIHGLLSQRKQQLKKRRVARMKIHPSASIMSMMKEMYDRGDDNMKKMIGETMLTQREERLGAGDGAMGGI